MLRRSRQHDRALCCQSCAAIDMCCMYPLLAAVGLCVDYSANRILRRRVMIVVVPWEWPQTNELGCVLSQGERIEHGTELAQQLAALWVAATQLRTAVLAVLRGSPQVRTVTYSPEMPLPSRRTLGSCLSNANVLESNERDLGASLDMVVSLHVIILRPWMRCVLQFDKHLRAHFQGSAPAAVRIMAVNFTGEATLTLSASQKPPPPPGATALAGTCRPQAPIRQSLCTCAMRFLMHWLCAVVAASCCFSLCSPPGYSEHKCTAEDFCSGKK